MYRVFYKARRLFCSRPHHWLILRKIDLPSIELAIRLLNKILHDEWLGKLERNKKVSGYGEGIKNDEGASQKKFQDEDSQLKDSGGCSAAKSSYLGSEEAHPRDVTNHLTTYERLYLRHVPTR